MSRSWQSRALIAALVFGFCATVSFARTSSAAEPINPFPPTVAAAEPINPFPPTVAAAEPINPFPPTVA